ncbi:hypothetical protein EZV62_019381 [Acer yangbiense]|uniref:GPI transamidase component PIG-S n=1 Tax=Acer yangbiense TaxID=1000413 RepID=A0A5C7HC50_9ROSI|nr:hypothetical protein EZV62_019381 [Acer yangbiense]
MRNDRNNFNETVPDCIDRVSHSLPETSEDYLKFKIIILVLITSFVLLLLILFITYFIYVAMSEFHGVSLFGNHIQVSDPSCGCGFFLGFPTMRCIDLKLYGQSKHGIAYVPLLTVGSPMNQKSSSTLSMLLVPIEGVTPSWLLVIMSRFWVDELTDEHVTELLEAVYASLRQGKNIYTVAVVNGGGDGIRVVVGKYRHAWIVGGFDFEEEEDLASRVAEIFAKVFVNGGRDQGMIHGEFMPVGADGRIVLSFNLLNAEPNDWVYDWDFQRIDESVLAPIMEVLGPIANISVESQVLYHTPKSSFSYWDEKQNSYIFNTKDLPFFVNSNEWHLDTSIAAGGRSKILQFVVYVPSAKECPLRLQLPNGEISKTNGFISPMWGGAIVLNPRSCLKDLESKRPQRHIMSPEDLREVFEVFLGQFRQLFGLKSDNIYVGESGTFHLLPSERGFTEWELDVLSRQHTCFNLHSCVTTLGSLSRLVQSLPRMIIMDEIGKQVQFSLEAAKLAQSNASQGVYESSAVSSRQARSLAEDAFFHPSIMSVSYYSFEHCFAVYSPFFLPVLMHVLLAALREWRRYKKEKAKYLAWKKIK